MNHEQLNNTWEEISKLGFHRDGEVYTWSVDGIIYKLWRDLYGEVILCFLNENGGNLGSMSWKGLTNIRILRELQQVFLHFEPDAGYFQKCEFTPNSAPQLGTPERAPVSIAA